MNLVSPKPSTNRDQVLNFVLETVSHGFGFDFMDDNDVFCDQCTEVIFGKFFHCNKCNDGDYDLCRECKEKGLHCEDKSHELVEAGEDLDETEIEEAITGKEEDENMDTKKDGDGEENEDDWEDDSDDGFDGESPLYIVKELEPKIEEVTLRSRAPMEKFESPFKGWSVEKLYDFWKAKLRRNEDEVADTHLSAFTFAVIDEETIKSFKAVEAAAPKTEGDEDEDEEQLNEKLNKTTVLVCSDAPDFGEGENEVKLKTVRMSLNDAASAIMAFELLAVCPSEFGKEDALSVMPPPTLEVEDMSDDEEEDEDTMKTLGGLIGIMGKPATPRKARENKRKAIQEAEKGN